MNEFRNNLLKRRKKAKKRVSIKTDTTEPIQNTKASDLVTYDYEGNQINILPVNE